jgi:hypothetical protein
MIDIIVRSDSLNGLHIVGQTGFKTVFYIKNELLNRYANIIISKRFSKDIFEIIR